MRVSFQIFSVRFIFLEQFYGSFHFAILEHNGE